MLRFLLASTNWAHLQAKNYFPEPNLHILTFFHPILMCRVVSGAPVGMRLATNKCRSEKCGLWTRECAVHVTKHLKKFSSVFRLWKAQRHFIPIIYLSERGGVLCPFIKSGQDLIGWRPLKCHEFIANSHSNQNDTQKKIQTRWINSHSFFLWWNLPTWSVFFQKMKMYLKNCDY